MIIRRFLLAIKNILWICTNAISLQFYVGDTAKLVVFVQMILESDSAPWLHVPVGRDMLVALFLHSRSISGHTVTNQEIVVQPHSVSFRHVIKAPVIRLQLPYALHVAMGEGQLFLGGNSSSLLWGLSWDGLLRPVSLLQVTRRCGCVVVQPGR